MLRNILIWVQSLQAIETEPDSNSRSYCLFRFAFGGATTILLLRGTETVQASRQNSARRVAGDAPRNREPTRMQRKPSHKFFRLVFGSRIDLAPRRRAFILRLSQFGHGYTSR